jgi:hypothetical protein
MGVARDTVIAYLYGSIFKDAAAMNEHRLVMVFAGCIIGIAILANFPAHADTACFASSKSYRIHPLRSGSDIRDGWTIKGGAFNECVHRAEAADRALHAKYPDAIYALSLAATIGGHQPC